MDISSQCGGDCFLGLLQDLQIHKSSGFLKINSCTNLYIQFDCALFLIRTQNYHN